MEQFWIMTGTIFHFLAGCGLMFFGGALLIDAWRLRSFGFLLSAALFFYAAYRLFESV
jgi:hypothetical protein